MYQFTLEAYRGPQSRYTCPNCGKRQKFTRYIDTETGEHLADDVGKCDRLENCGYHYPPHEYFKSNPNPNLNPNLDHKPVNLNLVKSLPQPKYFDTIPQLVVDSTMRGYDRNHFSMFLARMFGAEGAMYLVERYRIGSAKHWPGATVFWQIDTNDKVRTGKIMLYNGNNCKRVKEPFSHIAWAHRLVSPKSGVYSLKSKTTIDSRLPTQAMPLW